MEKRCQVRVKSWHHSIADDARNSKVPLILLKSQLFISKLKKRSRGWIVNCSPQLFWIAFSVGYFHKVGILEFSIQEIDESVCSRCMEILVICNSRDPNLTSEIQVLRSCGYRGIILSSAQLRSLACSFHPRLARGRLRQLTWVG